MRLPSNKIVQTIALFSSFHALISTADVQEFVALYLKAIVINGTPFA